MVIGEGKSERWKGEKAGKLKVQNKGKAHLPSCQEILFYWATLPGLISLLTLNRFYIYYRIEVYGAKKVRIEALLFIDGFIFECSLKFYGIYTKGQ